MSHVILGALGVPESGAGAITVEDNFAAWVYEGSIAGNHIITGINFLGEPAATVDSNLIASFGTTLYHGSGAAQDITTTVDINTDGGMTWFKNRGFTDDYTLFDTVRGATKHVRSNTTSIEATDATTLSAFGDNSFSVGTSAKVNTFDKPYVAWTFKQQAKFFDVVTYTGTGSAKTEAHSLGQEVGMMLIKRLDTGNSWAVFHRSNTANPETDYLVLDTTAATVDDATYWNDTLPTTSVFTVGTNTATNASGGTYVAYLFAHDTDSDGIIQCGTFTGTGTDNPITLGWPAQYLMIKATSAASNWMVFDTTRSMVDGEFDPTLLANSTAVESNNEDIIGQTPTGFTLSGSATNANGVTYVYMAIRAPVYDGTSGGMTWTKFRTGTTASQLNDTDTGGENRWDINSNAATTAVANARVSFTANGHILNGTDTSTNSSGSDYISWTFRKAPRFFDIVSYVGTGSNTTFAHNLEVVPGMMIVKSTDASNSTAVFHKDMDATAPEDYYNVLSTTAARLNDATAWNDTAPTDSVFSVGTNARTNGSGVNYVAYLFAEDPDGPDADGTGMITCGGYTGTGAVGNEITIGWEPQFILMKVRDSGDDWIMIDTTRGWLADGVSPRGLDRLYIPNSGATEGSINYFSPTATGFIINSTNGAVNGSSAEYIFMAVRRGMKVPESATEVFSIVEDGSNQVTRYETGFQVDLQMSRKNQTAFSLKWSSRLQGLPSWIGSNTTSAWAASDVTSAESTTAGNFDHFDNTGFHMPPLLAGASSIFYSFSRAAEFFDVVTYEGDGIAGRTVDHQLKVAPEFMIVKRRDSSALWAVYAGDETDYLVLNATNATADDVTYWNDTAPSATEFTVGDGVNVNASSADYFAYLWATLPGISKVFSYTGDGTTGQTIDCGFDAGARFIMIKRTDSTGSFYLWDSVRGIVAGNDPYLNVRTTSAEVTTDDSIDPDNSGFIVNQTAATNVNVTSATYIGIAIA